MRNPTTLFPLSLLLATMLAITAVGIAPEISSDHQKPLDPGGIGSSAVPAFPVVQAANKTACRLDLSDELFGGVSEACGRGGLDRSRCCPVLAAWLFAAHARSALEARPPAAGVGESGDGPVMPDDSQRCVDSLQRSLEGRGIRLARPNASCDTVLCFCGIRLHQIGSLTCPAAFNMSAGGRNATPTAAVRDLERHCRNASYAGCTRCLQSLELLKYGGNAKPAGSSERASRMFGRDCQLMGLTWLLARNRTLYIPTVSAVLRAVLYSAHPPAEPDKCSPDQENMPLAVDSIQFQNVDDNSNSPKPLHNYPYSLPALLLSLAGHVVLGRCT